MAEHKVHEDGTAFDANVGDELVLRLPENSTTGYKWSVEEAGEGLEPVPAPVAQRVGSAHVVRAPAL